MTPLLTPPGSIWMSLKVVFLDNKKLIISEKHLKSALNPISKSGEPANTGAQVQILYLPYISTIRHDFDRVFFVVCLAQNIF